MLQERVSSDVYIFTSEVYVQVTAGAIVTPQGAVVIDTLPVPVESRAMAQFIARRCPAGVRYVILTHYHADHTFGAYLYPSSASIIAHQQCRALLAGRGQQALEQIKAENPDLAEVTIRLPDLTLDSGEMDLLIGKRRVHLLWTPGHAADVLSVFLEDDRILFASDTIMPVPVILDGDPETLKTSLQRLLALEPDTIVQGHGEVILRGEVAQVIRNSIAYLDKIQDLAHKALKKGKKRESLLAVSIESCGLSRVALDGQAQRLHGANLLAIYDRLAQEQENG